MEITEEQYQQVSHLFPVARRKAKRSNLPALNAVLYRAEQGCQGRGLPESFGPWTAVYMRWSRWNERGALVQVFAELQRMGLASEPWAALGLDRASVKAHPVAAGAPKKGPPALGQSRGGRSAKAPGMAADDGAALTVTRSPGQAHDGGEDRKLLILRGPPAEPARLLRARAYAGYAAGP